MDENKWKFFTGHSGLKRTTETRPANKTYLKGRVSCSNDSFMVNQAIVFQNQVLW